MRVGALAVDVEGDSNSKLAILLPGLLDTRNYPHFKHFSKILVEEGFKVVRFDPCGSGESDGGIEEFTRANFLDDIKNLIDHFGKDSKQVVLIGHSYGGANAILAAAGDQRITQIIATAPAYSMRRIDNEERNKEWERTGIRESDRQNDDGTIRHYRLPVSFLHEAEKHDVEAAAKQLKIPALLIAGKTDDTVDPSGVTQLAKGNLNVTAKELDIGHDYWQPGNENELEVVVKEILNFLKPPIQIVNEQDDVIGAKAREDIKPGEIYRVAALWLTNSKDEVLIAQRKLTKRNDPGKWGPAAAGTVEESETYESNIYKEAEEEIGLTGVDFSPVAKLRSTTPHNHFIQLFSAELDKQASEFKIQLDEVEKVAWASRPELIRDVKSHPEKYVPSMQEAIDLIYG